MQFDQKTIIFRDSLIENIIYFVKYIFFKNKTKAIRILASDFVIDVSSLTRINRKKKGKLWQLATRCSERGAQNEKFTRVSYRRQNILGTYDVKKKRKNKCRCINTKPWQKVLLRKIIKRVSETEWYGGTNLCEQSMAR